MSNDEDTMVVQDFCKELQDRGIDTSNWDGDESPEYICAYNIACLINDFKEKNIELRSVLIELMDACKKEPAMNNVKYDGIGIRANNAIANSDLNKGVKS